MSATTPVSKTVFGLLLLVVVGSTLGIDTELPCYVDGLKCLPGAFSALEPKTVDTICGSTAISDCLESAKNKCAGAEAESAMNAVVVNYKNICNCTKTLHICGGEVMTVLKTERLNARTFINVCNKTETLKECLNESPSFCPPTLVSMWRRALGALTVGCQHAACFVEVEECGGTVMKEFLDAKNTSRPGSFGLDTLDNICNDRDRLAGCFNSSAAVCPEKLVSQWHKLLETVSNACEINSCFKKISACGLGLAGILRRGIMPNPNMFANRPLQDLCSERDNLTSCINSSTPECPRYLARQWSSQLDTITVSCEMLPCVNKISDCGSKLAGMFKREIMADPKTYVLVGNGALQDMCSEMENLTTCINSSTPECPRKLANQWRSQLDKLTPGCDLLPCVEQLDVCHGIISKTLMKPLSDTTALNTVCNDFDDFNACIRNATECPSEMRTNFTIIPEKYKSACTQIAECSSSLLKCAGESAKVFLQTIGSGQFDLTIADKLCDVEKRLVFCFNQSSTCPHDYLTLLEGSMLKVRTHCNYLSCAKKVQQCGVSMFNGIDIRQLNKETLFAFCSNIVDVESCLTSVDKDCPEEVSRQWKTPMKTWAARCTSIVKRYLCDQHKCKNEGTCVATLTDASCLCKDGFEGEYCEVDMTLKTTTITVRAPVSHGSTVAHTASVILAAVSAGLLLAVRHVIPVV